VTAATPVIDPAIEPATAYPATTYSGDVPVSTREDLP
jgi:hypothetical protein